MLRPLILVGAGCFFLSSSGVALGAPSDQSLPLNRYPFIYSHDAATGDIIPERDHIVVEWTATQSVSLPSQLDCGARSFDYRPFLTDDGDLFAHHGPYVVRKPMQDVLEEVIGWCGDHIGELVLFDVNDFGGADGCYDAAVELVNTLGLFSITDCNVLSQFTYASALSSGKLSNGGNLIVVFGCVEELYDDSINCYGQNFTCYDSWPEGTKSIPFAHMESYLYNSSFEMPVSDGRFFSAQALWQSTASNVILGTLHNSSLLLDEARSGLNAWLTASIKNGDLKNINLVEVNNICDGGPALFEAIQSYVPHSSTGIHH